MAERLAACWPWARALLAQMLPRLDLALLSAPRRFLVLDASGIQAPGARGTQYRLHLCMEMVTLTSTDIAITDQRTGESLKHFPLGPGDVAVADRGHCHPEALIQTVQWGADGLLRLNPHNVPLSQRDGTPLDVMAPLETAAREADATDYRRPVLAASAVAHMFADPGRTTPSATTSTTAARGQAWTSWVSHSVPTITNTGHCRMITYYPGAYAAAG
jgi:hypothetical protein